MNTLLVPVLLVNEDLECGWTEVGHEATAQDVLNKLLAETPNAKRDILGDLEDQGWALQKLRREEKGRKWEEKELEQLGDGLVSPSKSIAPLLEDKKEKDKVQADFARGISRYDMTKHLHEPALRLVSLNPELCLNLGFRRHIEVHDTFEYKCFISTPTLVSTVISQIKDELGMADSIPGEGPIEYVMEEVWTDGLSEDYNELPGDSFIFNHIKFSTFPNPFSPRAKRTFRICISHEWLRRNTARTDRRSAIASSMPTVKPSQATIRRLGSLQESLNEEEDDDDSEEEGEGTAKLNRSVSPENHTPTRGWTSSVSAGNRLSSLFGGWMAEGNRRSSVIASSDNRKSIVSEPLLMEQHTVSPASDTSSTSDDDSDIDHILDDLGLSGEARARTSTKVRTMSMEERKLFKQMAQKTNSPPKASPVRNSTYGPSSGGGIMTALVPQLTGGDRKRFSIWNISSSGEQVDQPLKSPPSSQTEFTEAEIQPLVSQTTGSIWNALWVRSGGDQKDEELSKTKSARWYVDQLKSGRLRGDGLKKHLLELRVQLSTGNLVWMKEFVSEKGADQLDVLLVGFVGKGPTKKTLSDADASTLLETTRCFRALLNTDVGLNQAFQFPKLITHIAFALSSPSPKVRVLVCYILVGFCLLPNREGFRIAKLALTDYRNAFGEDFRFETIISTLKVSEMDVEDFGYGHEEKDIWEARTAAMLLLNALTTATGSVEDRIMLREEYTRLGLNEAIVALRYIGPTDDLLKQLDYYTEEKYEDEENVRERMQGLMSRIADGRERMKSDSESALEDIIRLAKQHEELYPTMVEVLNHYRQLLERDIGIELKAHLLAVLDQFVQQASQLDSFDEDWHTFIKRFTESVESITGQALEVKAASEDEQMSTVKEEVARLRKQVDELSQEKSALKKEMDEQMVEINTYKSLPIVTASQAKAAGRPPHEVQGFVQRVIAKEKEVKQLQSELDQLRSRLPSEAEERAKRERDRIKWHGLNAQIDVLKHELAELTSNSKAKDQHIQYLKRALETVWSRFKFREEERDTEIDPEQMANRFVQSLELKDKEIERLTAEVTELKAQLAARPKSEKEAKMRSPPPPPPSSKAKQSPASPSSSSPRASVPPPPPPPPPPPNRRSLTAPPSSPSSSGPASSVESASVKSPVIPSPPSSPPPPPMSPVTAKPRRQYRPLFWNKIPEVAGIWSDMVPEPIDLPDFDITFSIDTSPQTPSQLQRNPSKKQAPTTLLDITRANNIAIMLSRIKMGLQEIKNALLALDEKKLSTDDLRAISKQIPTSEEVMRIKDFDDVNKLSKADQYFAQIITIPRLAERLDCMLFQRKLELDMHELRPELDILRNACLELRNSQKFKRILNTVLAIGNTLNGSTFRGGARGFQLDALLKLKETKTVRGGAECPTLLHYLAKVLMRTDPDLLLFIQDMKHLEAAARVSVQFTVQAVNSLVAGLNQVVSETEQLRKVRNLSTNDKFIEVMKPFAKKARPNIDALKAMASQVESDLRSLLAYYGENPDSTEAPKPEDFFGLILSFSSALEKCAVEVDDYQKRQEVSLPKPAISIPEEESSEPVSPIPLTFCNRYSSFNSLKTIKSQPQATLLSPSSQSSIGRSLGRGDLDQAIRSMRDGKRRPRQAARPLSKIFLDGAPNARSSRIYD
ncbi:hypothetical protein GYMLUDRAFT_68769 [Collybiopsis luxurians FD-317 M1]|nr:hypothetical protein GYMLUDRAFT_68769 [Collybiopsis luxurians FD-317 M1]